MSAALGVHVGTTSVCLAVCRDGKATVVANDAGDRVTPAVVAFTDRDQVVGLAAKQGLIRNANNTICNTKWLLGKAADDPLVETMAKTGVVKIKGKDGQAAFEVTYKEKPAVFKPQDILTLVYKKMLEISDSLSIADNSHDAVLTVPVDFTEEQRDMVQEAATAAGFNVLRIIHEPTAAVLAYDIGQADIHENCNALVYRLGGTSLDVTIVNIRGGMYRIVSAIRDETVGGHDFTGFLVEHFAAEFQRLWKQDCRENRRSLAKLRNASENCKHILSKLPTAQCPVESLFEGIDFQATISRARFDGLCGGHLQKCLEPVEKILQQTGLTKADISKVIVCGGSTKIPSVQQKLQAQFPDAEFLATLNPDEVIATGAAKEAAILAGTADDECKTNAAATEVPCLERSILIQTTEESQPNMTLFSSYTPVPMRRQLKFQLQPDQTSFSLTLLQESGEKETQPLGKVVMQDLPAGSEVTGVFHLRSDGSLHVTCSEPSSNTNQGLTLEAS